MIGHKSYEITSEDLIRGMSTSTYLTDGGFSNETDSINLTAVPGLAYSCGPISFAAGTITGKLIASSEDPTPLSGGAARLFVDDLGNYYSFNGVTLTNKHTDGTNPTKYVAGQTDMVAFAKTYGANGTILTTNQVGIVSWILNADTFNDAFFSFTNQNGTPHPGILYKNNAYYGDGNILLRQTAPDATPASILVLSAQQTIVTIGIDPGSGLMLLSTIDGLNASDTLNKVAMIQYYDGVSPQVTKQVICDDMVTAFHPVGAVLYITYGQNLGYWNSSGIQFLRMLSINLVSTQLAYKQHLSHIDTTLYVIEGAKVLAYGNIVRGQAPVFYYPFQGLSNLSMIADVGSGVLGCAEVNAIAINLMALVSMNSVASVGRRLSLYSTRKTFPRPVTFMGLVIEYGVALLDAYAKGVVTLIDDKQAGTTVPMTNVTNEYQAQGYVPSISTRSIQIKYLLDGNETNQLPIRRITVYYSDNDGKI